MALKIIKSASSSIKPKMGGGASSPAPFIDRLSVVLEPASQEDAYGIHDALWPLLVSEPTFIKFPKAQTPVFRRAAKLQLPSIADPKKYPLLQYAWGKENPGAPNVALKLRLDFMPVDLGWKGMVELHAHLNFLPDGWEYVVKHGHITRIDVAVDFHDVGVGDFLYLPPQLATTKQWRSSGVLTGYTSGKKKGNQTIVYDRGQKRIDAGQSSKGKTGTRVERRLRHPEDKSLASLPSMPNPFATMTMSTLPKACPLAEKDTYVWELFKRAVEVQSLSAALGLLPKDKRKAYREHFKNQPQAWWQPNAIWAQWPAMLDEMQIAKTGW